MVRALGVMVSALALAACLPGQKAATAPSPSPTAAASGRAGQPGVAGTIVAVAPGRMTVRDRASGNDVQVTFDSTVPITRRGGSAGVADLQQGVVVLVRGQPDQSGRVRAQAITIAPAGGQGPPGSPGAGRG